jgi:hypothetical protein
MKKNKLLNQKAKLKKTKNPSAGLSGVTVSPSTKGDQILRPVSPSLPPDGKDRNILRNVEGF